MAAISKCAMIRQSTIPLISPSMTTLSPFLREGNRAAFFERARMAETAGASTLHLDIFDPRYVNTGGKPSNDDIFNPPLAAGIKNLVALPIDAHFMVRPSTHGGVEGFKGYLSRFGGAVDFMSVHHGAFRRDGLGSEDIRNVLGHIRELGIQPGLVVNPDENSVDIKAFEDFIDFGLVMTVIPGDGGRGFDNRGLCNISRLGKLAFSRSVAADGAITDMTIKRPFDLGARWFVVGSYWFGKEGAYKTLDEMQAAYESLIKPFENSV